ncbi:MAG: DUF507 family protein [Candidatus Aminicenantia bacterium]
MSQRLSREKINYLAKLITNNLLSDNNVDFLEESSEIRHTIVKTIESVLDEFDRLSQIAVKKIESQKKAVVEESREWEILYRKYYNEELAKLPKIWD